MMAPHKFTRGIWDVSLGAFLVVLCAWKKIAPPVFQTPCPPKISLNVRPQYVVCLSVCL